MKSIKIVSCGPSGTSFLTEEGKRAIAEAERLVGAKRLLQEFPEKKHWVLEGNLKEMAAFLKENDEENTAVLVTGDAGFYSLASFLVREGVDCEFMNGISSFQYFFGKLRRGYEGVKLLSLHGRQENLIAAVTYQKEVFCLTGGDMEVKDILRLLSEEGLGHLTVTVGEDLGMDSECITKDTAENLRMRDFSSLSVMFFENPSPCPMGKTFRDEAFIRGKVPMTKEETRWISVSKLDVRPCDVVYDIGAGTGSVAVELATKAFLSMVYAIEQKAEALSLIEENRRALNVYNVKAVPGTAPEALLTLPKPDKVFIGGSSKKLREILGVLLEKNPSVKVALTAVTLETLSEALSVMKELGFSIEVTSLQSARSEALGRYHMMNPNRQIYLITGERPS